MQSLMPGLTIKVFRTVCHVYTLNKLGKETTAGRIKTRRWRQRRRRLESIHQGDDGSVQNHQKGVSKAHDTQMEKLQRKKNATIRRCRHPGAAPQEKDTSARRRARGTLRETQDARPSSYIDEGQGRAQDGVPPGRPRSTTSDPRIDRSRPPVHLATARAASSTDLRLIPPPGGPRRAAPRASSTADESASRVCGNSAASGA